MAITKDDFGKIWASTSPLTPYSFSESQYKEGWNFIGSTPPSRQMWDFLQKNNDEKMQYLLNNFDNYLPLSGGTLTGVVNGVTPTAGDNSTKIATTAFVNAKARNYLPLSGGTVTGDLDVTSDIICNSVTSHRVNVRSGRFAPVNTLQRSTAYAVDDIVYTSALNAKYYLLCVTAGTTSATMPSLRGAGSNTEVTDGTVVWRVQTITSQESVETRISKSGLPVGFETFTTNPNLQAGWLPLLGGEYSRTTYADLWAWVQTQNGYLLEESAWQAKAAANSGNVPFYSKGDGSTTFRVPALKCWIKGPDGTETVGTYLEAGLPNITGTTNIRAHGWESDNPIGALKGISRGNLQMGGTNSASVFDVNIDASRSSAIYGASDTVQPESIVGMWVVKAYGTVTNVGSTDVANISTGLAQAETRIGAAETRISTLENHDAVAYIVAAMMGQNGYVKFSNGLILQWGYMPYRQRIMTWTYPIAFTQSCFTVLTTRHYNSTDPSEKNMAVRSYSLTQATIDAYNTSTTGVFCMAIGE